MENISQKNKNYFEQSNSPQAQEALKFFLERFQAMDQARKPHRQRFETDEKLFRSHLETSSKADWQSKYFIPRIYGLVMASLSEFAINKPDILLEPDTRGDGLRLPYLKAIMYANWRKNKGNGELLFAIFDALKLGIGLMEIGYRKNSRKIKDILSSDEETGKSEWKWKDIYDFDDVFFETINPRYFWIDESASTIGDAMDCVRQYVYGKQAFHAIFDSKFPRAEGVKTKGDLASDEEFFKPFVGSPTKENEICVYKYTNKVKDVTWWIANGILLNDANDPIPFHHKQLPYADIKLAPFDKYTFYGMSLPRMVEDVQNELNTLRNMMIDQTHLNIFSPFFFSAEEDINENLFVVEPGVGIPVTDPSGFHFFKQQPIGQDAYQMSDRFDDDAKQTTGFDLRLQGLSSGGTATETAILKETSLKRINLYLRFMEELAMPDFAELWKDTIQQFYFVSSEVKSRKKKTKEGDEKVELFRSIKIPKSEVINFNNVDVVGGYNFIEVKPEDIRGKFDVNVKIGTSISISKELDKQVKLQLYSIMANEPLVRREKLVVDVLKAHEYDPEEYMTNVDQKDMTRSFALAEEHNKQLIAGKMPQIIEELITPEHIQIHDALAKSPNIDDKTKQLVKKHVLEEMRVFKTSGMVPNGQMTGAGQLDLTGYEKLPALGQRMVTMPGMTRNAVLPETVAETGTMVGKSVIRP